MKQKNQYIQEIILSHYAENARSLPWRVRHGSGPHDPYPIWLSEIMLQQTLVAAVIPYFKKFIGRWPTVRDLGQSSLEEVLEAWAGLGYYSRARNLHACARILNEEYDGVFPQDEAELRKLPGIGAYSAAAIRGFAFGRYSVIVEANIERIIARIYGVKEPMPAAKKRVYALMDELTPKRHVDKKDHAKEAGEIDEADEIGKVSAHEIVREDRPLSSAKGKLLLPGDKSFLLADRLDFTSGDFAQGMMDFGQKICTPKNPHCDMCRLLDICVAGGSGNALSFPVKPPRRKRRKLYTTFYWIEVDGEIWLYKRPDKGVLANMLASPDDDWTHEYHKIGKSIRIGDRDFAVKDKGIGIEHIFTHIHLYGRIVCLYIADERHGQSTYDMAKSTGYKGKADKIALGRALCSRWGEGVWWSLPKKGERPAGLASLYRNIVTQYMHDRHKNIQKTL